MKKILFVALFLVFMQSCITSLHPLYTDSTLIAKKELLALWKDKEGMYWRFMKEDDSKLYRLRCRSKNMTAVYAAGLVKFGDNYFLDVQMEDGPISDEEVARLKKAEGNPDPKVTKGGSDQNDVGFLAYNIPGHNFYKLAFKGDNIYVYPFNDDYLEDLFKQRKVRIKHEKVESSLTVLTASTQELQDFFKKYGDDPKLFKDDEPKVLRKLVKK
ncbi:hypothetical protein [Haliscomenobacter sp.]|uniref:hypothetical protein n=1 Tax=Haliscomenobacter sp. TaxID=2717303 RepID=UPI0035939A4B